MRLSGFTLIEIMVAVSIFTIVAVICTGAFITANQINQKAQAIKLAMDNLNFALDDIVFKMKEGTNYRCITTDISSATDVDGALSSEGEASFSAQDCPNGSQAVAFRYPKGALGSDQTLVVARFITRVLPSGFSYGLIQMAQKKPGVTGQAFLDLTTDTVDIDQLSFLVRDATGSVAPKSLITLNGKAVVGHQQSGFSIQTLVAER